MAARLARSICMQAPKDKVEAQVERLATISGRARPSQPINSTRKPMGGPARAEGSAERLIVGLGLEADDELALHVEHRPLDHGGLIEHQRDRLPLRDGRLVLVGELAERRPGAVEQRFPANGTRPALEPLAINPGSLVVVERVGDAVLFKPGAGLLHRLAVLDTVDGDWLRA